MYKLYEKLHETPLLNGINAEDFDPLLTCVQGRVKRYKKGQSILLTGEPVRTIGLVVSGTVQVIRGDCGGRQHLLAEFVEGELFGEDFACVGIRQSPVTVLAATECEVLHLTCRKIIETCASSCAFHQRMIKNMLALVAQKNLELNQKMETLSKRTTRERLLCYLDQQRGESDTFTISLNREELAEYLCVDRSAMSAELSRMQRDGVLRYKKNHFHLL